MIDIDSKAHVGLRARAARAPSGSRLQSGVLAPFGLISMLVSR